MCYLSPHDVLVGDLLHHAEVSVDISEVRVRKVEQGGKLKAYVTVTFDDQFVVHNIKIIEGQEGNFIAMPSRQLSSGEFKDIVHPITSSFREELQATIMKAYEEAD